jgi:hypothetical protein
MIVRGGRRTKAVRGGIAVRTEIGTVMRKDHGERRGDETHLCVLMLGTVKEKNTPMQMADHRYWGSVAGCENRMERAAVKLCCCK